MRPITFGSLFAGIGGFDLGLERAGFRCAWQVEIHQRHRKVLARHWPDVRRHDDVRTFPPTDPSDWAVDVICGGFPCQDLSYAGHGVGIGGERSGLWAEFARIVRVVRPRYVIVENVPALLARGMGVVLGDLAAGGFDAEWDCIPAFSLGAAHARDRTFVVAYPVCVGREQGPQVLRRRQPVAGVSGGDSGREPDPGWREDTRQWLHDPGVPRIAHGVPDRVDRITGTGNAVHTAVAEWIGRKLMDYISDR